MHPIEVDERSICPFFFGDVRPDASDCGQRIIGAIMKTEAGLYIVSRYVSCSCNLQLRRETGGVFMVPRGQTESTHW